MASTPAKKTSTLKTYQDQSIVKKKGPSLDEAAKNPVDALKQSSALKKGPSFDESESSWSGDSCSYDSTRSDDDDAYRSSSVSSRSALLQTTSLLGKVSIFEAIMSFADDDYVLEGDDCDSSSVSKISVIRSFDTNQSCSASELSSSDDEYYSEDDDGSSFSDSLSIDDSTTRSGTCSESLTSSNIDAAIPIFGVQNVQDVMKNVMSGYMHNASDDEADASEGNQSEGPPIVSFLDVWERRQRKKKHMDDRLPESENLNAVPMMAKDSDSSTRPMSSPSSHGSDCNGDDSQGDNGTRNNRVQECDNDAYHIELDRVEIMYSHDSNAERDVIDDDADVSHPILLSRSYPHDDSNHQSSPVSEMDEDRQGETSHSIWSLDGGLRKMGIRGGLESFEFRIPHDIAFHTTSEEIEEQSPRFVISITERGTPSKSEYITRREGKGTSTNATGEECSI